MIPVLLTCMVLCLLVLRLNLIVILLILAASIHLIYGDGELVYMAEDIWAALDREALLSIPLFLLCGTIMCRGAIAERLVEVLKQATCSLPGGLGAATILSCAFFAAISGSSMVTLLAVGTILYPALLQQGYSKSYALGALTSAGTLGVVIPPSIPMIVYGIITETSITDMFLAGIIPGLILTLVLTGYSVWRNRRLPRHRFHLARFLQSAREGIWSLLMPVILLGGIYSGYFTATESAAIALTYAIFIETFVYRELTLKDLYGTVTHTAEILGSLVPIIAIAMSLNLLLTAEQVPNMIATWMTSHVEDKWVFIIGLNVLLLAIGCLMEIISAILIMAPILLPVAIAYGIHPVHLGIIMVINLEIGLLTPPVGINLVVATTAFKENFLQVTKAVIPFMTLMIGVLALVSFVPAISLYLVN